MAFCVAITEIHVFKDNKRGSVDGTFYIIILAVTCPPQNISPVYFHSNCGEAPASIVILCLISKHR